MEAGAAPFWAEAVVALFSAEVEEAPPVVEAGAPCVGEAAVLDEAQVPASEEAGRLALVVTVGGAVDVEESAWLRASAAKAAAERLVPVPMAWHPVADGSVGRTAVLPAVDEPVGPRAAIESSPAAACR